MDCRWTVGRSTVGGPSVGRSVGPLSVDCRSVGRWGQLSVDMWVRIHVYSTCIAMDMHYSLFLLLTEILRYQQTMESGTTSAQHGRTPLDHGNFTKMARWSILLIKDKILKKVGALLPQAHKFTYLIN